MKSETRRKAAAAVPARLRDLMNVGPAMERDLNRLGITEPGQLAGQDPFELYERLCARDGHRHDPCVLDTFMAIVEQADGAPARPWWHFTPERKARLTQSS